MQTLVEVWTNSAAHDGWWVGRFMLMPDHTHFFAAPAWDAKPRSEWCKLWKSVSSRRLTRLCGVRPPVWQSDTFDHLLRSQESYAEKWNYVRENPVRAGLVKTSEDWRWQGEIFPIGGRDVAR